MRLALAQINTTVGDLDGNRERIVRAIEEARDAGAELVLLPALAVTRSPPHDPPPRPRLSARGSAAAARVDSRRGAVARRGREGDPRHRRAGGDTPLRSRPLQRV